MRKRRNKAPFIVLLSAVITCLAGCGIETVPYLEPVPASYIKQPLSGELRFIYNNYDKYNINYFDGYEIYYKFYSADTEDTSRDSETEILDLSTSKKEKLDSYGYKRLTSLDDNSFTLPLISVDTDEKKTDFEITIDFTASTLGLNNGFTKITYLENELNGARYAVLSGDAEEDFYGFINTNDFAYFEDDYDDFSTSLLTASDTPDKLYLVLYVMAYGQYDLVNDLYSKPVKLGEILLTVG